MKSSKDTSYRNLLLASVVTVIVLLFAAGSFTYQQLESMVEQRRLVLHTHELIAAVGQLKMSVRDAESGQRGYLLTGRDTYLRLYERGREVTPVTLRKIDSLLTSDLQKSRLLSIKNNLNEKMNELSETVRLARIGDKAGALKMVLSDAGENSMSALTDDLQQLQEHEEGLLEEGTKKLSEATTESFSRLGLLAFIALGSFLLAAFVIHNITMARSRDLAVQETIFEVSKILASSVPPRVAVDRVLEVLSVHFGWSTGIFWQPNSAQSALECKGFYSAKPVPNLEAISKEIKLEKNVGLPGRVWNSLTPHWSEDVVTEPDFPRSAVATKDNLRGGFAFPILLGDQFIGVIEFFSERVEPLSKETISSFQIIGIELGQFFERQKLETAALAAKGRFEELAGSIDDVFFIVEPDMSREIYLSPAYEQIWGRPLAELEINPMAFIDGIHVDDRPKVQEFLASFMTLKPGDFAETEYRVIHTSGGTRWVNVRAFPSTEAGTNEPRVCGTVRDITRQKDAERRVNEFYSTVSHELRTPLTSIRGALGLLEGGKAGELSARGKKLVEMGRTECDRLVRLINDILDVRKLEAGKLELKTERILPSQTVDQILHNMHSYAADRDVKLTAMVDCDDHISADRDRLAQILTNLVSNAVKYAPPNSEVLISTKRIEANVRFSVTDKGVGISKDDQTKLFKLFQQVDSSDSRPKEGTGLGLAICKALVEQHGGTIGLESDSRQGATFWFELPRSGDEPIREPQVLRDTGHANKNAHRILIVEDDDSIAQIMSETLIGEGFVVERVSGVTAALSRLESNSLAAVILDLGLPDGDGFDLIDEASKRGIELPVVIVTAREQADAVFCPFVVDWITKPFGHERLIRAVKLAVNNREPGQARVLIVEDDPSTRDVIKQQLQSLDVQVFEAKNGRAAIDIAQTEQIDLIVLDLGLPDIDGFTVVSILRGESNLRETPLIVYTAKDLTDSDRSRLRLGLTSYLTKAKTSEDDFMLNVRNLLNGLLKQPAVTSKNSK